MILVNETHQDVSYWISCDAVGPNCGDIPVDGMVKLPDYDNQTNVYVGFKPAGGALSFDIQVTTDGHAGEQVEMALVVE
jgi:hypothetical protein